MVITTAAERTDSRDAITGHAGTSRPEDVGHAQHTGQREHAEGSMANERIGDIRRYQYHTEAWGALVEQGWVTMYTYTDDLIRDASGTHLPMAVMIFQPEPAKRGGR